MNRGSRAPRTPAAPDPSSFNEAPIHESGKSRMHLPASGMPLPFNEAPIHESGKCDLPKSSMRRCGCLQ